MTRTLRVGLAVAMAAAGCATTTGSTNGPSGAAARVAPDFTLPALGGADIVLSATRGNVTLVDFWASWCVPCREELPELEKLQAAYASKGVKFIAVNIDDDRAAAADMAKQLGITMPVALDADKKAAALYNPPTMPSSFVIDRAGTIRYVHAGFDGSADIEKFKHELDALLAAAN